MWPFPTRPPPAAAPVAAPARKASATGALVAFHTVGRPVWTPRDLAALAREGYMANAVVHACVRLVSEAVAGAPWTVSDGGTRVEIHPLLALLARPNPGGSGRDLVAALVSHLQIAGNAYLEAVTVSGTSGPRVAELHVLRPDRIKVIPGRDGWPQGYEYAAGSRAVRLSGGTDGAVLHLRLFAPLDDHYGMSPLEAAARAVDIHNAAGGWVKALLDNAARPSGALVYSGTPGAPNLSDDQFERLRTELTQHYQGAQNAGRPMLLEGGLDWKPMGFSPADMEFIQARHAAAREIALAFGVPPMLLGIPGDNTYANYQEASRAFARQTVLPLMERVTAALDTWLAPRFGPDVRVAFDRDRIPALLPEREALWARLGKADFLTLNEKRAALGFPPIPGGDTVPA